MFRCRQLTDFPALKVPLYTHGGVGEVMEGPWVRVGSIPQVGDLTGWPLSGKVQKSWNTCWALPVSGTFEGGFNMTAGERRGEGAILRLTIIIIIIIIIAIVTIIIIIIDIINIIITFSRRSCFHRHWFICWLVCWFVF